MASPLQYREFKTVVYSHYRDAGRSFAWRDTGDPYRIWVSEIMLQQTQTHRVAIKYEQFLVRFPTVGALAAASLPDLLEVWQGLGYNRRALAMQRAAQVVAADGGEFPATVEGLQALPGIGPYTASAIAAFAYNIPTALIETNIRRVYIHHFFEDAEGVEDKQLMPLIEATLDREDPRNWYYALMDYGAALAKQFPNPNRRSKHYTKQSAFEGSNRQIRGGILKRLLKDPVLNLEELVQRLEREPQRVQDSLAQLEAEGFVVREGESGYRLGANKA